MFLKAETKSAFHVPINMGTVFDKTFADIQEADAWREDNCIVLSRDVSPWKGEHYFAVDRDVPGHEMIRLSGDYITRVFEGPYRDVPKWIEEMEAAVDAKGRTPAKTYFFYTTCPKCSKEYGENYVVGVTELEPITVEA